MNISFSIPCKTLEGQQEVASTLFNHMCRVKSEVIADITIQPKVKITQRIDSSGRNEERWTKYYVDITIL